MLKYNLLPHQFVLDESKILHIRFANRTFAIVAPWFLSLPVRQAGILMNVFLILRLEWISILCTKGNVHVVFY